MHFGAVEPRSVTAKKLNELAKIIEALQAEVTALKEDKPVAKKATKKAEAVEAEAE